MKKKTYMVTIPIVGHYITEVMAENKDEAVVAAWDKGLNIDSSDAQYGLMFAGNGSVRFHLVDDLESHNIFDSPLPHKATVEVGK